MTVYLVSCVAQKRDHACEARDLYISPWFLKARRYVERQQAPWFILSAQWRVLRPGAVLQPYERSLHGMTPRERRAWADETREALAHKLPGGCDVVILAGRLYWQHLIGPLVADGHRVSVPLQHMGIGQQLGWFDRQEDGYAVDDMQTLPL